jgi:hypothetical protein
MALIDMNPFEVLEGTSHGHPAKKLSAITDTIVTGLWKKIGV